MFKRVHVFRVRPGQELLGEIQGYCRDAGITSAVVIGIIGSAERARLNYLVGLPGRYESVDYEGPLEIVCGQGSVALKGGETVVHIHIQLADRQACRGGHLAEAVVFSTAEVVIGELERQLRRQHDSATGLNELTE